MNAANPRFIAGIFLLVTNPLVGLGGMLIFGNLARKTGRKVYYFLVVAINVVSWAMLLTGVYLVGRDRAQTIMGYIPGWVAPSALVIAAVSYFFWKKRSKKCSADKDELRS